MNYVYFYSTDSSQTIYDFVDGMVSVKVDPSQGSPRIMKALCPIWDILRGKQLYLFAIQEIIEVSDEVLAMYFTEVVN